jgi:hypothetical protein
MKNKDKDRNIQELKIKRQTGRKEQLRKFCYKPIVRYSRLFASNSQTQENLSKRVEINKNSERDRERESKSKKEKERDRQKDR